MQIEQYPAFNDNYLYLVSCPESGKIAAVDPGDADVILKALGKRKLDAIFCTHHHQDHIGGVQKLKNTFSCPVYASTYDAQHKRIPADHSLKEGDTITLGNLQTKVLDVPGHTLGHIAYYFAENDALFCGDTLFAAGCGRLFEGTPEQMFTSLQKIKALPSQTKVYCAHEYTAANLAFLHQAAPNNQAITKRKDKVEQLRAEGIPTIPTSLEEELTTNLFLTAPDAKTFAELRHAKDNF